MMHQIGDFQITTIVTDEPWSVNCYLARHILSGEQILIDPGDAAKRIEQMVTDYGGKLKAILLTHAHHDHVGAVADICRHFAASCYLHKADARLMRQAHTYALVFAARHIEPFLNVSLYEKGNLNIDGWPIDAVKTPGHTPGSVCYDFGGFIFTGDTLLYQYVGRTDTPGANEGQIASSVGGLMERLSEQVVIFPGHGRAWTAGEAKVWWKDAALLPPQYKQFGGI